MGEEVKKEEEKPKEAEEKKEGKSKEEEKAKEGGEEKPKDGEEKKEEAPPPPPPEEVEMRVYMHCEGCARKVKKILKRFDGVEDVIADSKAHRVLVKGKKAAADPMKVVERVQKKTGRKVELLSPIPPPPEEKKEEQKEEPEPPKPEEKKEPPVIAVVLKVHMHCEACAQVIRKKILKMKGVQTAEPDLKASEVTVKGVFEEAKLAEYVHKRTGKHAAVVKSELVTPPENAGDDKAKEEKKAEGGDEKKEDKEEKKDGKNGGGDEKEQEKEKEGGSAGSEEKDKDKEKDAAVNLYMHYPRFGFPGGYYPPPPPGYAYQLAYPPPYPPQPAPYAPQIFSDENPNACSVM
ncbi:heavy metal-associated isoprenylated plant protein 7-like [Phragmites australis]|uniref:heavy metal-associated isoprenylated plant protein 7-like n=1 Tax=Phragmites australis TaxID=29695 RepID=UPI002D783428|nr:heavy metal-associated isoprenylated plant protein 7-like [Phragmites australis]XP_062225467.1 heavy metal-associated isoprenylated plant protein 7-like [Phragmites australis]